MAGEFEVRITPLILGQPGYPETEEMGLGVAPIEEGDTTLVTQFADPEVEQAISEGTVGRVTLSMHDPVVETLAPFAQALRIAHKRPGEAEAEVYLFGACNVIEDYESETVTLEAQDRSHPLQHHYIRRGDEALNMPDDRGMLRLHPDNLDMIVEAGRNIEEQQDRNVPVLGLWTFVYGDQFIDIADAPFTQFERGQECWALIQEFAKGIGGPDLIMEPQWTFPAYRYGYLTAWDAPTDPEDPGELELGRNLDPADPDDPQAGDVVFDFGRGLDNAIDVKVEPGRPTTHAHVLDRDKAYRVTSADADSSAQVGVWVDWIETDQTVPRPVNAWPAASVPDLRVLQERADVQIEMLGVPPKHFTITLRPDDALTRHFGHPFWPFGTPGDWYLGDYVRVRADRGYRSFSTLARITRVKLKADGWNGLPYYEVSMIPAIGGTPGTDYEEVAQGGGSVVIHPEDDSNETTLGVAVGVGVSPTGFEATPTRTALGVAIAHGVTPTDTQPAGSNLIRSLDRRLKLASTGATFDARGVDAHVGGGFAWGQSAYDAMEANGINTQRLCVQWEHIETSPGVFNATELNYVQQAIDRAAAANIKTIICLGITDPNWSQRGSYLPSWSYNTSGPVTPAAPWDNQSLFDVFISMGEAYARKMVQQFGGNENVIGFDPWNEPDHQPASEVQAGINRWLGWVRDEAESAGKLWFVTNSYSSQSAGTADNDWDAITDWTNCVLQLHVYYAPASPSDDGWNSTTGMRSSGDGTFWNGGPEATTYNTANKAAFRNHFSSWKTVAQAKGVPWVIGEFGVQYNKATALVRDTWARDMVEAAELEECAGVIWWIYGTNSTQDPWSASPGGVWRPEAQRAATFVAF